MAARRRATSLKGRSTRKSTTRAKNKTAKKETKENTVAITPSSSILSRRLRKTASIPSTTPATSRRTRGVGRTPSSSTASNQLTVTSRKARSGRTPKMEISPIITSGKQLKLRRGSRPNTPSNTTPKGSRRTPTPKQRRRNTIDLNEGVRKSKSSVTFGVGRRKNTDPTGNQKPKETSFLDELLAESDDDESDEDLLGELPESFFEKKAQTMPCVKITQLKSIIEGSDPDHSESPLSLTSSISFTPGRKGSSRRQASCGIGNAKGRGTGTSRTRSLRITGAESLDLQTFLTEEEPLEEKSTEEYVEIRTGIDWQPPGIANLGNTCYFNSLIQSLFSCEHFCQIIWESIETSPFLNTLRATLCRYHNFIETDQVLSPHELLSQFRSLHSNFNNSCEHDAQEALNAFLNSICKYERKLDEIFRVRFQVERKLILNWRSHPIKYHQDSDFVLRLNCVNKTGATLTTLEECLKCGNEWKPQDSKMTHEEDGKKYDFEQRTLIRHDLLPKHLFIHLARFTVRKTNTQKLKHIIDFPVDLDLSPFTSDPKTSANYSLHGVITHVGPNATSGHYYATVTNSENPKGALFRVNDETVTPRRRFESGSAYILLYGLKEEN